MTSDDLCSELEQMFWQRDSWKYVFVLLEGASHTQDKKGLVCVCVCLSECVCVCVCERMCTFWEWLGDIRLFLRARKICVTDAPKPTSLDNSRLTAALTPVPTPTHHSKPWISLECLHQPLDRLLSVSALGPSLRWREGKSLSHRAEHVRRTHRKGQGWI